ncbi:MAG: hypothetical protein IPP83_19940 [Flavobacteriales bacterium]|nr:hypothetical protein [Flavobacteriales bacterium]
MRTRLLLIACLLFAGEGMAQRHVVNWAYGPFATPEDAAFVVDLDRISLATGPFGERGRTLWIYQDDQVFRSVGRSASRGNCAFTLDGDHFMRTEGAFCTKVSCVFLLEKDRTRPGSLKVHRAEGPFCTATNGGFVIEQNVVYLAEGVFANRADAILILPEGIALVAVLTILAGS